MIRLKLLLEGSASEITPQFKELLKNWENSKEYKPGGWNKSKEKWFPHRSPEGGTPTIAYGHKLTSADVSSGKFNNGITDEAALALLAKDLEIARSKAMALVPSYSSLPISTKQALINACYRGELSDKKSPKTLNHMRNNNWKAAAEEYLNHAEYRSAGQNVRSRMEWNYTQFKNTATKSSPVQKQTSDTMNLIKKATDVSANIRAYDKN